MADDIELDLDGIIGRLLEGKEQGYIHEPAVVVSGHTSFRRLCMSGLITEYVFLWPASGVDSENHSPPKLCVCILMSTKPPQKS